MVQSEVSELFQFVQNDNLASLKLVFNRSKINIEENAETLLSLAAHKSNHMITAYLLEHEEIDVNLNNPIYKACEVGAFGIVKMLASKPDINLNQEHCTFKVDAKFRTPFAIAVHNGHVDIVNFMILKDGVDLHKNEPIVGAIQNNHLEVVRIFLDNDSYSIPNSKLLQALFWNPKLEMVKYIFEHRRVNLDEFGDLEPFLKTVVEKKQLDVFKYLLSHPKFTQFKKDAFYSGIESFVQPISIPIPSYNELEKDFINNIKSNDVEAVMYMLFADSIDVNTIEIDGMKLIAYCLVNKMDKMSDMLLNYNKLKTSNVIINSKNSSLIGIEHAINLLQDCQKDFHIKIKIK